MYRQSEKKLVKQQYNLQTSSQYGELRTSNGWDRFGKLGHPSKFQRVSRLGLVTAATTLTGGQPNFARCLAVSWAGTVYIHFRGLLPPGGISPCAKFTLRPNLAFFYIGSITAWHSSSGRQWNFAAWYKEWNYETFAEGTTYIQQGGHHVGHRPTFLVWNTVMWWWNKEATLTFWLIRWTSYCCRWQCTSCVGMHRVPHPAGRWRKRESWKIYGKACYMSTSQFVLLSSAAFTDLILGPDLLFNLIFIFSFFLVVNFLLVLCGRLSCFAFLYCVSCIVHRIWILMYFSNTFLHIHPY